MITDLTYLKTMSGGDANFIAEMIGLFSEQIDEYSELMPRLLREKDYDGLSKLAHKAKSSAAVMGMTGVAEILKELEKLAHEVLETHRYEGMVGEFLEKGRLAVEELKLTNLHTGS
jgi:HPt (histidine-containing phosphotransfer) domain-containing protein